MEPEAMIDAFTAIDSDETWSPKQRWTLSRRAMPAWAAGAVPDRRREPRVVRVSKRWRIASSPIPQPQRQCSALPAAGDAGGRRPRSAAGAGGYSTARASYHRTMQAGGASTIPWAQRAGLVESRRIVRTRLAIRRVGNMRASAPRRLGDSVISSDEIPVTNLVTGVTGLAEG